MTTWCDSAATGVSLSYSSLAAALEGQAPAPTSTQDQVSAAWCPLPGPMGQDTQQGHLALHPHRHPLPGCQLGFPRWCFQAGRQAPWRPGWAGGCDKGRRGLWEMPGVTRAQGHVTDSFSGVSCSRLWDLHPPQSVQCWADSGLCLSAPHLPIWEEKSLCNCPPAPPRGIGGHPHPTPTTSCLLASHPRGGIHIAHTVRNALLEEGAWRRQSGETQSFPRKGVVWSVHPPNPGKGGPPPARPPSLASEGGR